MDPRDIEGDEIIDKYFRKTFKNTSIIIKENKGYFKKLKSISKIYILGHSLSKVDYNYYKEIINNIDKAKVKWKISFFKAEEYENHCSYMKSLGINLNLVEVQNIYDLLIENQLKLF